jgi:predicted dehydrogenase
MPELAIALAGCGMVSRHHLIGWSKLASVGVVGARVVAVADPDRARAEARAAEFGIPAIFADVETMLRAARPDALDIAAPVGAHAALCRLAAAHRVAILCQKPLAPTLAEAAALVAGLGPVRFMVHENWRFRLPYRQALAWLAAGAIGDVVSARLAFASSGLLGARPALARQPFLGTMPRLIVFEVLIHHLDVLRCLLGEMSVTAAVLSRAAGATLGEDTAAILLAGGSGAPILCTGTMAAAGASPIGADALEIIGTAGAIRFDGEALTLSGGRTAALAWDSGLVYQSGYDACLAHFAGALAAGTPFETAAADNLRTLGLVEAVYSAAATMPSTRP